MIDAIKNKGVGATGSRLLSGDYSVFHDLEQEISNYKQKEAALIFNTGFQGNIGIISALAGKEI